MIVVLGGGIVVSVVEVITIVLVEELVVVLIEDEPEPDSSLQAIESVHAATSSNT